MQVKSRVVLSSWHVNKKLKTKLNDFLKKMVSNTERIPAEFILMK